MSEDTAARETPSPSSNPNSTGRRTSSSSSSSSSDVYARLYDKRSYTGVYRKRFELECHDLSECVVHDLSNTIRTNLKYDVDPRTKRSS